MLKASCSKHVFQFIRPGGTSRGVLHEKTSWHIFLSQASDPSRAGIGECSLLPGLSPDDKPGFESRLQSVINQINRTGRLPDLLPSEMPAMAFGLETAMKDLTAGGNRILYDTPFSKGKKGIMINGLIWMGSMEDMRDQIKEKIDKGFRCLKLKIGAIHFEDELNLLRMIRKEFEPEELEIRLDANGAFSPKNARIKLEKLAEFSVHSIEQPLRTGQWEEMASLCFQSPIPIVLDEELIGLSNDSINRMMITIQPSFVILKPSLVGGIERSEWIIRKAKDLGIGWWVTSALEGNIGLNAIAQWVATLDVDMPQGLGTGQVFSNNIPSPLEVADGLLHYRTDRTWDTTLL